MHLGLKEFLTSEPGHIIAPIGATFLRQRAAQMQASFKRSRVDSSSSGALPHPSSTGDPITDAYVDPTAAAAPPPPFTSDDSDIRRMLKTIMTI